MPVSIVDIPERVKVGPYRYRVVIEPEVFAASEGGGDACGQVTHSKGLIQIAYGPPHRMFETLLHEVIHAISYLASAGIDERQTVCLGAGLAAFLIDNGYVEEPDA